MRAAALLALGLVGQELVVQGPPPAGAQATIRLTLVLHSSEIVELIPDEDGTMVAIVTVTGTPTAGVTRQRLAPGEQHVAIARITLPVALELVASAKAPHP